MESRPASARLILACALVFLAGGVSAVLALVGVIELPAWLTLVVVAATFTPVAVAFIGDSLADEARSRDPFLFREPGQRALELDASLPVGVWVNLGSSSFSDDDDVAY